MKLLLLALLTLGLNSFACPGGEVIDLNDDKQLTAYSLYDISSKTNYMFSDDLNGRDSYSYGVADSSGERTHYISLYTENRSIIVEVENLSTNEVKKYRGQYGIYRGCNEIVEIE